MGYSSPQARARMSSDSSRINDLRLENETQSKTIAKQVETIKDLTTKLETVTRLSEKQQAQIDKLTLGQPRRY